MNALREAGSADLADEIAQVLVGRDVMADRWTFELVEDYDTNYWSVFRDVERTARHRVGEVEPHVLEADMKHAEQSEI